MKRGGKILSVMAITWVGLGVAVLSHEWLATGILAAGLMGSFVSKRISLDFIGQVIMFLASIGTAYLFAIVLGNSGKEYPSGDVGPFGAVLALTILIVATGRLYLKNPVFGHRATSGILVLAVLAVGEVSTGMIYPVFALSSLLLLLLAMWGTDAGRTRIRELTSKQRGATVIILLMASIISGALILSLPKAYAWVIDRFEISYGSLKTGFSTHLILGSVRGMYQSDEVVLRVKGGKTDHLRGIIYTRYVNGMWLEKKDKPTFTNLGPNFGATHQKMIVIDSIGGERDRYFVPIDAIDISLRKNMARVNQDGIILTTANNKAQSIAFTVGKTKQSVLLPPSVEELAVPRKIKDTLGKLSQKWTAGLGDEKAKLAAIEGHLKNGYRYSLDFEQDKKGEPLITFLTRQKMGHCEFFASAMALLARSEGIPARVVGGYRVHEYNDLGEYFVVRQRNAHTWVEVWLSGEGWKTYDPTPSSDVFAKTPEKSPLLTALLDLASEKIRRAWKAISRLTTTHIAIAVACLVFLWIIVRIVRRFRIKIKQKNKKLKQYSDPLPVFIDLLEFLKKRGKEHAMGEPLEAFAGRISDSPGLENASLLLMKYAAWRYGGQGDEKKLTRQIKTWLVTASKTARH